MYDLQRWCIICRRSLLAHSNQTGLTSRPRWTEFQSTDLLGCLDLRHAFHLSVVRGIELYQCQFISNAPRFSDGLHRHTEVDHRDGDVSLFVFASFSVLFLQKKLSALHWLGIATVVAGLSVVGVSDVLFSQHPEGSHSNTEKIAGDALILVGMLFTSCQVEKHRMNEEDASDSLIGCVRRTLHWKIQHSTVTSSRMGRDLRLRYFGTSPYTGQRDAKREDDRYWTSFPCSFILLSFRHLIRVLIIDWKMSFQQSVKCVTIGLSFWLHSVRTNRFRLPDHIARLGNVFSIAFFNFAGVSVTKELSSTTRMVLDSGRTLIIWIVSLVLQWQSFYPLQILGSFLSLSSRCNHNRLLSI